MTPTANALTLAAPIAGWDVLRAGPLNTVQDLGRPGRLHQGIPPAGAMDAFALQVGNLLCGNPRGAAAVEIAPSGLVLRARMDQTVAVTGADFSAVIGGNRVARWKSFDVRAGQTLAFGGGASGASGASGGGGGGAWAYLCLSGGVAVPDVLGGKSTCLAGQFGGLGGRALQTGDTVPAAAPAPAKPTPAENRHTNLGRGLAFAEQPVYAKTATVRVVLGPQGDRFPAAALQAFLTQPFTVTPQCNRMGYRLAGPALTPTEGDLLSEATATGAIQVPAGGQPIVLLCDRPATGGYPKIATVISADLPVFVQVRPGESVQFREVSVAEAQQAARQREELLAEIARGCGVV